MKNGIGKKTRGPCSRNISDYIIYKYQLFRNLIVGKFLSFYGTDKNYGVT